MIQKTLIKAKEVLGGNKLIYVLERKIGLVISTVSWFINSTHDQWQTQLDFRKLPQCSSIDSALCEVMI